MPPLMTSRGKQDVQHVDRRTYESTKALQKSLKSLEEANSAIIERLTLELENEILLSEEINSQVQEMQSQFLSQQEQIKSLIVSIKEQSSTPVASSKPLLQVTSRQQVQKKSHQQLRPYKTNGFEVIKRDRDEKSKYELPINNLNLRKGIGSHQDLCNRPTTGYETPKPFRAKTERDLTRMPAEASLNNKNRVGLSPTNGNRGGGSPNPKRSNLFKKPSQKLLTRAQ